MPPFPQQVAVRLIHWPSRGDPRLPALAAAGILGRALYAELFAEPVQPPNNARFVFLNPRSKDFYVDRERGANDLVAILRSSVGRNPNDRSLMELIGELSSRNEASAAHGRITTCGSAARA